MADYSRFAVYYVPPDGALMDWASAWLGWDLRKAAALAQPVYPNLPLPITQITKGPRKYGVHATLKPPFALKSGKELGQLLTATEKLAKRLTQVSMPSLELARLGAFAALVPTGDTAQVSKLAAACVRDLDDFRAGPVAQELTQRRKRPLSPAQEANLIKWGYPYVMDEFRFHITLTNGFAPNTTDKIIDTITPHIAPLLPRPFVIDSIALCAERQSTGRFEMLKRFALPPRS